VSEWLFTQAAGIDTDGPGFGRIRIRPELVDRQQGFEWVKATYHSVRGPITSSWKLDGDTFRLKLTIPCNSTATVHVPAGASADVAESGQAIERAKGVRFLRMEDGRAVVEVGSGSYTFKSRGVLALGL
jgi:alpha-L-rhamnosidase